MIYLTIAIVWIIGVGLGVLAGLSMRSSQDDAAYQRGYNRGRTEEWLSLVTPPTPQPTPAPQARYEPWVWEAMTGEEAR